MTNIDDRIKIIETELEAIKTRNRRVENDKAWETSFFRLAILSLATFIFSLVFLYFVRTEEFLLGALSSTAGLVISSQSLPFIKRWWIINHKPN